MKETTPLESFLNESRLAKTKIAVIIPLYGYWKGIKEENRQLDLDALRTTLNRVHSMLHEVYIFFVAHPKSLTSDIANELVVRTQSGNTACVPVEKKASYGDYVRAGIDAALSQTEVKFITVLNPWVIVQHQGLDRLVERLNKDDAKVVSGYDVKRLISADESLMAKEFDGFNPNIPDEIVSLKFDFVGMSRETAQVIKFDSHYHSHTYLEMDTWQEMYRQGYTFVSSQKIPIYPFDLKWELIEDEGVEESDRQYFISKWGFDRKNNE